MKKSAHMPKIGQNPKTKTFLETVKQKECNDKWQSFWSLLFQNKNNP